MRTLTRSAIVLSAAIALIGVSAVPAMAVDAPSDVEVAVNAGILSITSDPIAMPNVAPGAPSTSTAFSVTVGDLRAQSALGWVTTVSMSTLTGETAANTISPAFATYTATEAVTTGTATVAATPTVTDLTAATAVQTATAITGNNTAAWDSTLSVAVPPAALADTYTAILTQSVL